jgi:16S rRNA (cytosine1402-N4)-methyltransferase
MMAGRGSGQPTADGGLARHIPVLGGPAVEFLNVRDGGVYIDATFGAGGYTRAILAAANCHVIGIDRDQSAIAGGFDLVSGSEGRLVLVEDRFSNLEGVARSCGYDAVDGVVLDVGVSSMQLDEAARGFSFRLDGPLDMRMGGDGPTAADVIARASDRDLARIITTQSREPLFVRAMKGRSRRPARSPRSSAVSCMRVRTGSTRQRGRSRRCAFSSTKSCRSL